jgi:hypothetical protein
MNEELYKELQNQTESMQKEIDLLRQSNKQYIILTLSHSQAEGNDCPK